MSALAQCAACRRYGCDPGCARPDFDKWPSDLSRSMHVLAANLAVAAFGCLAFYYGSILDSSRESWRPGCNRPAPGQGGGE